MVRPNHNPSPSPEFDHSNIAARSLNTAKRLRFPPDDPFLSLFDYFADTDPTDLFVSVNAFSDPENIFSGTFAEDNWGHLLGFAIEVRTEIEQTPQQCVFQIRRFQRGPTAHDGSPYKLICGSIFDLVSSVWREIPEDELHSAHSRDAQTGAPIQIEPGLLFGSFLAEWPGTPVVPAEP